MTVSVISGPAITVSIREHEHVQDLSRHNGIHECGMRGVINVLISQLCPRIQCGYTNVEVVCTISLKHARPVVDIADRELSSGPFYQLRNLPESGSGNGYFGHRGYHSGAACDVRSDSSELCCTGLNSRALIRVRAFANPRLVSINFKYFFSVSS